MLCLTLKESEGFKLNELVEVIYIKRKGNQISIGINAPHDVKVTRLKNVSSKNKSTDKAD